MYVLSVLVVLRIAALFLLSYFHEFKMVRLNKQLSKSDYTPKVSVIVPAYNEEAGIYQTLGSIYMNDYPNYEVVVVINGTTDNTEDVVNKFRRERNPKDLLCVVQEEPGKGSAMNNGIQNYATGELIMTLDGDSIIDKDAIRNSVKYFLDEKVVASAANIKVLDNGRVMSFMQILEYLMAHRFKRTFMLLNMDFVIGGPGAMFRKDILKKVNYFETGTITEDLDLTMKIVALGNKEHKLVFAADTIVYTEAPAYVKSLHKQRFRWKKGKYQCLKKHRDLYFNTDKKYSKALTWFFLPYSTLIELSLFVEPILVMILLYNMIMTRNFTPILTITIFLGFYTIITVLSEESVSTKQKLKLILFAPLAYLFTYTILFIEYAGLLRTWLNIKTVLFQKNQEGHWEHVERLGTQMKAS